MAHAAPLDHVDVMRPPPEREPGVDVYNEKLGMWIFLGSEIMFFTALIGSYVILRVAQAPGKGRARRAKSRKKVMTSRGDLAILATTDTSPKLA